MRGYRFYLEHDSPQDKRKGKHNGNVFAAYLGRTKGTAGNGIFFSQNGAMCEGTGAVYFEPNSPVCGCSASLDWLRTNCKRILEANARRIHPRLFEYLDRAC